MSYYDNTIPFHTAEHAQRTVALDCVSAVRIWHDRVTGDQVVSALRASGFDGPDSLAAELDALLQNGHHSSYTIVDAVFEHGWVKPS